ncbi:MAG: glycosyltransferase family 4 protein [Persicimonas sp.]
MVLDATALDSGHRRRGIGRYVGGLTEGIYAQRAQHPLAEEVKALRLRTGFGEKTQIRPAQTGAAGDTRVQLPQWHLRRPTAQHRVRWVFNELFLTAELRHANAALYHSTEPWSAPVSRHFSTVLTCHDLIPLLFPEQYLNFDHLYWRAYYAWMERTGRWNRLTRIIAISEATRRSLVELLGVDEERIDVVYNGIDHEFFQPVEDSERVEEVRERYGLERPFVLYLGGYDFRKNIAALVEAMAEVPDTLGAELVLAGGMGEETAGELDALAGRLGVEDHIRHLGYIDDEDVPAMYSLAQVFAYPSLAEGFGLQALEAMACGCPVVAANCTSLPEVLGEAGLLVDPRRPTAIAEAISRILEDDAFRQDLRERGLERAAEFSWERCARETLEVYERAL